MASASIKQLKNLENKDILVRCDFDLPLKGGRVADNARLKRIVPTLKYLLDKKANLILIGHAGRPGGKFDRSLTLRPVKNELEKILKKDIKFITIDRYVSKKLRDKVIHSDSNIIMLENLRFSDRERANCKRLAKNLASLADIYVNEAFANSHRTHASMVAVRSFLPDYIGLNLEREISHLSSVLKKPKKPLVLIIGGAKIETKLPVIKSFLSRADSILVGGAVANNFIAARGLEVGISKIDKAYIKTALRLFKKNVIIPTDVRTNQMVKSIDSLSRNDAILDIGPLTEKLFISYIKSARTIIWNGPMGKFEYKKFAQGTKAVANKVLASKANVVIGGGDTDKVLSGKKIPANIFVSSGGGAMLEFLAGKKLPGLKN